MLSPPEIRVALPEDMDAIRKLFCDYADYIGVDLSYQNFAEELSSLPGQYDLPTGLLLIARDRSDAPVGCVAMRPMAAPGRCEVKRLFVSNEARGSGLGRSLVSRLITEARLMGYKQMYLDTLPGMGEAQSLYASLGFMPVKAYYETPMTGTVFMRLCLSG